MDKQLVSQLFEYFKATYGREVDDSADLFESQRNLLEYLVCLGRELENSLFEQLGKGYEGATMEKEGGKYKFVGYRETTIHGLFGGISYERAYYVGVEGTGGSRIPLDEKLGIEKRHTPGVNYFLSSFTGREAYQESLRRFHEIFRPDGKYLVSMRKALDMDYALGEKIEGKRQEEIEEVFDRGGTPEIEGAVEGTMAVSVDATKVREKQGEYVDDCGKRRYEIGFRDAKIGVISEVSWDEERSEAHCERSSYVGGIEHADEFFRRVWVEMKRRVADPEKADIVFLGDGAKWIWDRVGELANEHSVQILDFYHAAEHVSSVCKVLWGEQTEEYGRRFSRWREMVLGGKIAEVITELKGIREESRGKKRKAVQDEITYFEDNEERMRYDRYRAMRLPIGSGTVECSCKNVIGARMKQGGMTWSESGAEGMLQIRTSLAGGRFLQDFRDALGRAA